jgi:hypothetical protein
MQSTRRDSRADDLELISVAMILIVAFIGLAAAWTAHLVHATKTSRQI